MNRKKAIALAVLAVLTPVLLAFCLLWGASGIGLPDVSTPTGRAVVLLRGQRVASGFLVGAALASAGVVFQAVLRNPLAEPYILGVSSGAGLGAAIAILTGLNAYCVSIVPLSSFVLAVVTLAVVYALAGRGGTPSVYGLILSGVIVSSVCSSLLMFLVAVAPMEGMHSVMWWMLGDLEVASRAALAVTAVCVGAGAAGIWLMSRELNALTLGREMAHHVGVRTDLAVAAALTLATLVAAAAVGLAGLIGFVGLIVPHVMRGLVGPDHRALVPAAALGGGVFLALCDAVARTALAPVEIPVGVVTALIGGPFFLAILRRRKQSAWYE